MQPPSASRRFLALWFPYLATDRLRASGAAPEPPFAVVEKRRGALRIVAVDPAAAKLGLAGLDLAGARARVPGLKAVPCDLHADRAWLELLADACDRWTPLVALDEPDGLLLDVTGCARAWGGEASLAADVAARTCGLGLCAAFGPTPGAARGLARWGRSEGEEGARVRALPVRALGLGPEAEIALGRAGLRLVGDLAGRPTAPLAARFGAGAVAALDRLLGREDDRLVPRRPPPALRVERRPAEPILTVEGVLAVLARMAAEAAEEMGRRGQGGRRFALRLWRGDGRVRDLAVGAGLPLRDSARVLGLFRERLEALADPLDPGFGFDALSLDVPVLERVAPAQPGLDGAPATDEDLAALLDRLSARLGPARVRRFAPRDGHIPELGQRAAPAADAQPATWTPLPPGEPPVRPLRLLDPPEPVAVLAEVPDGPPRRFVWRGATHDVTRAEGPERIAPEWWRLDAPGRLTRDYFRVEDAEGRRFWVFRHGLYAEVGAPRWYVHGLFA